MWALVYGTFGDGELFHRFEGDELFHRALAGLSVGSLELRAGSRIVWVPYRGPSGTMVEIGRDARRAGAGDMELDMVDLMQALIHTAEGREAADTAFVNARIVDVYRLRVARGQVAVKRGCIAGVLFEGRDCEDASVPAWEAERVVDCGNRYLAPGLIDGHLHIESSNIRPAEYARMALARGTTTAIADSHEIANVCGLDGLAFMIRIVDVYRLRVARGQVAVKRGCIAGVLFEGRDCEDASVPAWEAERVVDCGNRYLAPGLIDGHLHIESSNIRPAEYARMALARGTTTAIADSHEIANVCGLDGLAFMIEDASRAPLDIKFMMPSCVPALPDEQAGAQITAADMEAFMVERPGAIFGLGEMIHGRAPRRHIGPGRDDEPSR